MAQRLPNSIIREPRILTRTKLYFNEQIINIYNTHLTYADNQYRIKQMDYVKKHVDFNSYSILAGDFNSFKMNNKFKMEGVSVSTRIKNTRLSANLQHLIIFFMQIFLN